MIYKQMTNSSEQNLIDLNAQTASLSERGCISSYNNQILFILFCTYDKKPEAGCLTKRILDYLNVKNWTIKPMSTHFYFNWLGNMPLVCPTLKSDFIKNKNTHTNMVHLQYGRGKSLFRS